MENHDQLT